MRLKVLLPSEVLVDEAASKIIAEALNGSFCLKPRHIDFVTALAPGLMSFIDVQGEEQYLALDGGNLVKCGDEVLVSSRNAVRSTDLTQLKGSMLSHFHQLNEHEQIARSALARLEAGVVRRFIELEGLLQ
jgi:F-type H+-transporting ATPase subunit epsilon